MVKACLNGLFVQWPVIFPLPNTINDHYASPSSGWNSTHPTHCVSTLCRCATLITEKNSISNLNFPLETKAYVSCRFTMLISSAGHKKRLNCWFPIGSSKRNISLFKFKVLEIIFRFIDFMKMLFRCNLSWSYKMNIYLFIYFFSKAQQNKRKAKQQHRIVD